MEALLWAGHTVLEISGYTWKFWVYRIPNTGNFQLLTFLPSENNSKTLILFSCFHLEEKVPTENFRYWVSGIPRIYRYRYTSRMPSRKMQPDHKAHPRQIEPQKPIGHMPMRILPIPFADREICRLGHMPTGDMPTGIYAVRTNADLLRIFADRRG